MRVIINQVVHEIPISSKLADALAAIDAKPPYAVAINLQFIPKAQYAARELQENDQIEVIAPVTGG